MCVDIGSLLAIVSLCSNTIYVVQPCNCIELTADALFNNNNGGSTHRQVVMTFSIQSVP